MKTPTQPTAPAQLSTAMEYAHLLDLLYRYGWREPIETVEEFLRRIAPTKADYIVGNGSTSPDSLVALPVALTAAAPELLALVERGLWLLDRAKATPEEISFVSEARAAIAAAKGGSA